MDDKFPDFTIRRAVPCDAATIAAIYNCYVGTTAKVGHKFGRYIDVSFWQWSVPEDTSTTDRPFSLETS